MIALLPLLAIAGTDPAIQEHLLEVVTTLRAETPPGLAPDVRERRLLLLDRLEDYALRGEFPRHRRPFTHHARVVLPPRFFAPPDDARRAPLFVDDAGVHCAVGYLMSLDRPDLVARVVAEANDQYLLDMNVEGVAGWAAWAGFTPQELAWIQPEYPMTLLTCDQLQVPPPRPSGRRACGAHDVTSAMYLDGTVCQSCPEPGVLLWAVIDNAGEAVTAEVTLGDLTGGCLERRRVRLPAATVSWVGPFQQDGWKSLEGIGGVFVDVPRNCSGSMGANLRNRDGSRRFVPACGQDIGGGSPVMDVSCILGTGGSGGSSGAGGSGGAGGAGGWGAAGGAGGWGGSGGAAGSGGSAGGTAGAGGRGGMGGSGGRGGGGPEDGAGGRGGIERVPLKPMVAPQACEGCSSGGATDGALAGVLLLAALRRTYGSFRKERRTRMRRPSISSSPRR